MNKTEVNIREARVCPGICNGSLKVQWLAARYCSFGRPHSFSLLFCIVVDKIDDDSAIYRLIELSDGWNGVVISTQWLFSESAWALTVINVLGLTRCAPDVFDAAMVFLAMFILSLLHPGLLLNLK